MRSSPGAIGGTGASTRASSSRLVRGCPPATTTARTRSEMAAEGPQNRVGGPLDSEESGGEPLTSPFSQDPPGGSDQAVGEDLGLECHGAFSPLANRPHLLFRPRVHAQVRQILVLLDVVSMGRCHKRRGLDAASLRLLSWS